MGKPSISMDHLYHGYVTVITRGYMMEFLKTFRSKPLPSVKTTAPLLSPKIRIDWTFFVANFWIHQELKTLCEGFPLDRFA
jgi:hypothetical protein